jgi:hypothetical protein
MSQRIKRPPKKKVVVEISFEKLSFTKDSQQCDIVSFPLPLSASHTSEVDTATQIASTFMGTGGYS